MRSACSILVEILEADRPLDRPTSRRKGIAKEEIKLDLSGSHRDQFLLL
jgi:hypothetical protein